MSDFYSYPNRTVCDVLNEMRKLNKTRNYSALDGLIEEVQSMVNRMESALYDKRDIKKWTEERNKLKKEIKALYEEKEKINEKVTSINSDVAVNDSV